MLYSIAPTSGVPYRLGDNVQVQDERGWHEALVTCVSRAEPATFGLVWRLTVRVDDERRVVRVDDDGRNHTRGKGVRPSELVCA